MPLSFRHKTNCHSGRFLAGIQPLTWLLKRGCRIETFLLTLILFAAALKEEKNSCRLKFNFATDSRVALLKAY
ncbi:MAG: hypothetical protein WCL71_13510, partial [Deltaproteobacteria bacterium]